MLFSIITVVLNDPEGLLATGKSILHQTSKDYEWIIIDGGSTDTTLDDVRQLDSIEPIIHSGKDDGIYDAMNKGSKLASARYVVFMNAGDVFFDNQSLDLVAKAVKEQAEVPDVIFGGANLIFNSDRAIYRSPKPFSYVWHGLPANHQATYYHTKVLGEQPYDTSYEICADYHLGCVLFKKAVRAINLDLPLVKFRVGDTSYKNPWQVLAEANAIQKDVLGLSWVVRWLSYARRFVAMSLVLLLNKFK